MAERLKNLPLDVHTANMTDDQTKEVAADLDKRIESNTTPTQRAAIALGLMMVNFGLMNLTDIIAIQEGREHYRFANLDAENLAEIRRLADKLIEKTRRDGKTVYLVNKHLLDCMTKGGGR